MIDGIYVAASGGYKQEKSLEVITNNLANVNTIGFKRDLLAFKSFLAPFPGSPQNASPGLGASLAARKKDTSYTGIVELRSDLSQGRLVSTGNPLDVALEGEGFFEIKTKDGLRYTRQGNFKLNSDKILVTQNNNPVMGSGGPITIKSGGANISINSKGTISAGKGPGKNVAGSLKIVNFKNPGELIKAGDGLFFLPDGSSGEFKTPEFSLHQGFIEYSNVSAIKEMTKMIEVMRGYQAYQQLIQTIDSANAKAAIDIGRLA